MTAEPSIAYTMSGPARAPVIVLLHSLATSAAVWEPVLARLSNTFQVLAPDTRGHGESVKAPEASIEDWVEDIERVLVHAEVDRAALVGVSMGGIQALAYAARHPHRVTGLVVADSFAALPVEIAQSRIASLTGHAMSAPMAEVAAQYLADTFREPDSPGAQTVARAMTSMDRDSYLAAVRTCFGANIQDKLASVAAPTLVLWGDRDLKTPRPLSEAIRAGVPGSRLDTLPDAGHLSNIDNPDAFAQAVLGFLTASGHGPLIAYPAASSRRTTSPQTSVSAGNDSETTHG